MADFTFSEKDVFLVLAGVSLGILGQALYDMFRNAVTHQPTHTHKSTPPALRDL